MRRKSGWNPQRPRFSPSIRVAALLILLASTASAGIRVFPSGGGIAEAGANRIRAVIGETATGFSQNVNGCAGAGFLFGLGGGLTPVLLLDFTALPTEAGVGLEWHCADWELADFRLEASRGDRQWIVPWRELAPGAYAALDDSEVLLAGGAIGYILLAREAAEAHWIPLGRTELELPPSVLSTSLARAHPNPFNPVTEIGFSLREAGRVRLRIHDASGRVLRTLLDADLPVGRHVRNWDGRGDTGERQASGVYFLRMETGGYSDTQRLVLLK